LFDDFWALYWRKEAKKDAAKAWQRIDPRDYVAILEAVCAWRPIFVCRGTQFSPMPATWLNGERWTDELPAEFVPRSKVLPDLPRKSGEIPQHVKDQLAKLRR
jgi:hypothetical protein